MLKLGVLGFGGPAVHVAMLREEAVRRHGWLPDQEFLDLFGAVSVLPGPSSTQLAIVLGRRRAGWRGLVIGGACFIAPAMGIVLALAWAYVRYGRTPTGGGVLDGVGPVVVAIVAVALWELARQALRPRWRVLLGAAALIGYFAGLNVLVLLAAAGLIAGTAEARPRGRALAILAPVTQAITLALAGAGSVRKGPSLTAVALEFAKLGVVVFGSGYVMLAFLRRDLVTDLGWLSTRQVLDAVAAGQVTPGPVFTTATFVGYLVGGVPAALVATVGIFLPSFFMVAALEPLVARIRRSPRASGVLGGITAAALGLMAGVTVDLGRAALRDPFTVAIAVIAFVVILRWRPNAFWLVLGGAAVGLARALL